MCYNDIYLYNAGTNNMKTKNAMKQNKIIFSTFILFGLCAFVIFPNITHAADGNFAGGDGISTSTPYLVEDCLDLQAIDESKSSHYKLTQNIDCSVTSGWNSGAGFLPIATTGDKFTGSLNGDGYVISDLTINRGGTAYVGLFSRVGSAGVISNIGMVDADITASSYSGTFVGLYDGTITNVYAIGSVSCPGAAYCGGLVGYSPNAPASISNSYTNVSVSTVSYMGGIIGRFTTGTIENVYAIGSVTGLNKYGIIGSVDSGVPDVSGAYYDQTTTGAGDNSYGTSKTTAQMKTQSTFADWEFTVAGDGTIGNWIMAGYPHLQMEHRETITTAVELQLMAVDLDGDYTLANDIDCACSSWNNGAGFAPVSTSTAAKFTGTLDGSAKVVSNLFIDRTSTTYVGLFGYIGIGSTITEIGLEDIIVRSLTYSGGLVGASQGTISQSYTTGFVTSTGQAIGGLVGYNNGGTVSNSYSLAAVSSTLDVEVGGLIGWNNAGTITNSYSTGLVNNGVEAHDGEDSVGGLVGFSFGGTISNSFWDEETSGQDFSWVGTGKTTEEMIVIATYTDVNTEGLTTAWDFVGTPNDDAGTSSTWEIDPAINSGYVYLAWQQSDSSAPSAPSNPTSTMSGTDITVLWTNSTASDFVSITVRRSTSDYLASVSAGTAVVSATTTTSVTQTSVGDGVYYYSIFALDNGGNVSSAATTTITLDTTAPTMTLLGNATISQNQGQTYTDAGATATDAIDGDLTNSISTSGTVNTNVPGTYTITYSVSDAAGNAAISVTRTVTILSVGGGTLVPPGGVGGGTSDRFVSMHEVKHIGDVSVEGINLLAYINAISLFRVMESFSGSLGEHSLTITDLDLSENKVVTLTLASTPQTISLKLGASTDVDVDNDAVADMSIMFVALWNNRVELTLKAIVHDVEETVATPQLSEEEAVPLGEKVSVQCPSPLFTRDMKKGNYGSAVMALQQYLNGVGMYVAIVGPGSTGQETEYFGPLTEQALMKFQKERAIIAMGVFDVPTRKFLGCTTDTAPVTNTSVTPMRDLKFGMSGDDVKRLQVYLNANGFSVAVNGYGSAGNETTYFGELTWQAVIKFQTTKGIFPASGYVGPLTRQEIV